MKLVRVKEAIAICGLSKTTFYARVKEGIFPPPVSLGGRAKGWWEHEILQSIYIINKNSNLDAAKAAIKQLVTQRDYNFIVEDL